MTKIRLLLIVFIVSFVSSSQETQENQKSVLVIYTDKFEVELMEWQFLYKWDYDVNARSYDVAKRTSQDLFLNLGESTSHGVTERFDRRIPASELAAILYDWMPLKKDEVIPDLRAITVQLRNGEKISIKPKTPWSPYNIGLELEPSIWLLTDKKDIGRNARLYLIGKTRHGNESLDFEQQLWLPRGNKTELVKEIRFRINGPLSLVPVSPRTR